MDPVQIFSLGATLVGGFLDFRGRQQEAAAQNQALQFNAMMARRNAELANRAALDALARGEADAATVALEGRRLQGRQRAVLAGLGQDVNLGTAVDVAAETAALTTADIETVRRNAELEAADLRTRAGSFGAEAQLAESQAKFARSAGTTGALSSLLTTGGLVADKWYRFRKDDDAFFGGFFGR